MQQTPHAVAFVGISLTAFRQLFSFFTRPYSKLPNANANANANITSKQTSRTTSQASKKINPPQCARASA